MRRLVERLLRADGGVTEDRGSTLLAIFGGCFLDPLNDGFDPRAALPALSVWRADSFARPSTSL